jgi:ankyrin repeat protein
MMHPENPPLGQNDRWALHQAIATADLALARELIDRGEDIHGPDHRGNMPLEYAVKTGVLSVVRLLLESGARPTRAMLETALARKCFPIAALLADALDPPVSSDLLFSAVSECDPERVKGLVECLGIDVFSRNAQGALPVFYDVHTISCVKAILSHKI